MRDGWLSKDIEDLDWMVQEYCNAFNDCCKCGFYQGRNSDCIRDIVNRLVGSRRQIEEAITVFNNKIREVL